MIVKNEEAVLARCLDSIKDVIDEIIIVDTGSTDETKNIASRYTNLVFDFEWINDFSAARNEAFSKATMDYQMWLDADDVFPEISAKQLLELKSILDPSTDVVTMKYVTHFDADGNPILVSTRERLTKREKNFIWQDPIHEFIQMVGKIVRTDIEVHHKREKKEERSYRNLNIYEHMESEIKKNGGSFTPRQLYYFARELKDHANWLKSSYYFEKFINSGAGWVEDIIAACFNLSICYRQLGSEHKIVPLLLKSFEYDAPRAEICCEIGYFYKRAHKYDVALKWFQIAANLDASDSTGFILQDYHGYIPNIESCVCCSLLKDFERARQFNERAASYKNTPAIDHNREFLYTV